MVVAVIAMLVVQPACNQIVHVVAVGNFLVAAVRVIAAAGHGLAVLGIGGIDGQFVLVVMAVMLGMEMAIVEVVDVAVVLNTSVAAVLAVDMRMRSVGLVAHKLSWFLDSVTTVTYLFSRFYASRSASNRGPSAFRIFLPSTRG
jgi:hypothetical protein